MNVLRAASPTFVLLVLLLIGGYDVVTGLLLLLKHHPAELGPFDALEGLGETPGTLAVLRRLGAAGIVIGATTIAWAWLSREDRRLRSRMLLVYLVAGFAFGYTDSAYFSGDPSYLLFKRSVGAVFVAALVAHFACAPATPARRP